MAEPDGLTASQRYRLRHLEVYRARRREAAKAPHERVRRRLYMQDWRARHPTYDAQIQRRRRGRIRAGLHVVTPRPIPPDPLTSVAYLGVLDAAVYLPPKGLLAWSLLGGRVIR